MRSVVFAVIAVLGLFVGAFSQAAPESFAAQPDASPGGNPAATPGVVTPTPECTDEELALGETVFVEPGQRSSGGNYGPGNGTVWLEPAMGEEPADEALYLSVLRLPSHACLPYRYRIGAVVLFVQQGTIVYTATAGSAYPDPDVVTGNNDGLSEVTATVALDTDLTLHAGEWVSQDRPMWYTFRNPGPEEAIVAIASYVYPPWLEGDPCGGGCRTP